MHTPCTRERKTPRNGYESHSMQVMFERDPPRCTEPNDLKAFDLYQRARELEATGKPMEALPLFMRAAKTSRGIKEAYRL